MKPQSSDPFDTVVQTVLLPFLKQSRGLIHANSQLTKELLIAEGSAMPASVRQILSNQLAGQAVFSRLIDLVLSLEPTTSDSDSQMHSG